MILILSGLPGSGKTTEALAWVAESPDSRVRVNYDELRLELFGPAWKFNSTDESLMKSEAIYRARHALEEHRDVVIDNTNFTPKARQPWISLAKAFGVPYELADIDTPLDLCIARDKLRTGSKRVGRAVIERMALFHGWLDMRSGYNPSKFVIVDVDGTLAYSAGRAAKFLAPICKQCGRHGHNGLGDIHCCGKSMSKDWGGFFRTCDQDEPVAPIMELARNLAYHYSILIVSGRPIDQCGIATEDWLDKHWPSGPEHTYQHLFMRNGGDHRPDTVVKKEILDLLPKDRVAFVLDDRSAVVNMWRSEGLTCLQVAKGDF